MSTNIKITLSLTVIALIFSFLLPAPKVTKKELQMYKESGPQLAVLFEDVDIDTLSVGQSLLYLYCAKGTICNDAN